MTRDDPKPLDPDVRESLGVERAHVFAPEEAKARVFQRVANTVGLSGIHPGDGARPDERGVHPAESAGAIARIRAGSPAPFSSIVLAFVSFGIGALTGALGWRATHAPTPPELVYVARDNFSPPAAPSAQAVLSIETDAAAASIAVPSANTTFPNALAGERVLLDAARAAFGRGAGDEALAALSRDEKLYPSGQLAEEREALAVRVLVLMQRSDQARARATRFRRRYPGSVMLPAVEAALGTLP